MFCSTNGKNTGVILSIGSRFRDQLLLNLHYESEGRPMFEAIVSLCLLSDPAVCRDVLIPGYESISVAECDAQLRANPPDLKLFLNEEPHGMAACAPVGDTLRFQQAARGVFVHRGAISDANPENEGDVANVAFVIGKSAVAVIDSGGSRRVSEQIYRAVRSETGLPVRYVVLTHMHPDHVLGASLFAQAGAEIVGHSGLARGLSDRSDAYMNRFQDLIGAAGFIGTQVVMPDIGVEKMLDLDLGDRVLHLRSWPNGHSINDLTVGDPTSGILFTGDLMFHEYTPALDGSVLGWQTVLTELQALPYHTIMPGHGGPILDWPDSAGPLNAYLALLISDTRSAIVRGDSLGDAVRVIGQSQAADWDLFDQFNPRNATVAFTELEWE